MLPKNIKEFSGTLNADTPNSDWPKALKAIWYDAKDDWEAAHNIAQDMNNMMGSWMHAYLHRKEGDAFNAGYWYRQAGKSFPTISLADEHREMVEFVLQG